jgi:hypothetical protein
MARLEKPDTSTRPNFAPYTFRDPADGKVYNVDPNTGRRTLAPEQTALTTWPNENPPAKPGK